MTVSVSNDDMREAFIKLRQMLPATRESEDALQSYAMACIAVARARFACSPASDSQPQSSTESPNERWAAYLSMGREAQAARGSTEFMPAAESLPLALCVLSYIADKGKGGFNSEVLHAEMRERATAIVDSVGRCNGDKS